MISACLQDAVLAVGEMAFEPAESRFAALAVRRCRAAEGGPAGQAAAALRFDSVSSVKMRGIDRAQPAQVLPLAGIVAEPGRQRTVVRLLFQGGPEIWLEAETLACRLQDLEDPRPASVGPGESAP